MKHKSDIRIKKTETLITQVFFELVEIRGYENVTISQICKMANINRNTFYLHYESKEDLVKKAIGNMIDPVIKNLDAAFLGYKYSIYKLELARIRWWFRETIKAISPSVEMFRIILLDKALAGYSQSISSIAINHLSKLLDIKNPHLNLSFAYLTSGFQGVINQWIIYSPKSDATTAKILSTLAYNTLSSLREELK